jgi:hypothetical protein
MSALQLIIYAVKQKFSTYGCWRAKKQNYRQFSDPIIAIIVLKHRFWRPKSMNLLRNNAVKQCFLTAETNPDTGTWRPSDQDLKFNLFP